MYRRDSNDKAWRSVKARVRERDKVDRIFKILSLKEAMILRKSAGPQLNILDSAHYIAVSENPSLIYDENNIILFNRFSHTNLDSFKDPVDGHSITREEVRMWWERLLKGNIHQYEYLKERGLI